MAGELAVQTSPAPTIFVALRDALKARPNLKGVNIFTAEVGPKEMGIESILLLTVDEDQAFASNGRQRRQHDMVITGAVYSKLAGAGEDTIQAVRERVYAMAGEIEIAMRSSAMAAALQNSEGRATAKVAQVSGLDLDQGFDGSGRWATLRVELSAMGYTVTTG